MSAATAVAFAIVCVFFVLAIFARYRMMTEDNPRPGYIFDQERED